MFDSVLRRETLPRRRFGAGALIALAVHAGAVSFAIWAQATGAGQEERQVAVTFVKPPPPPPPPSVQRQARRPQPRPRRPQTVLPQAIVAPTVVPQERPPEEEPLPDEPAIAGTEGGEVGGVPGGVVGGVVDAESQRLEFDARMTPPVYRSGPDPRYTDKALEREVEGLMIVKCVVTTEGRVFGCRVLRSLPYMDRAVVEALEKRRYAPATLGGRPVEVDYTFRVRLTLPR